MNRVEFMGQLERLLYNLPDEERQDALAYYNDYFDEAGMSMSRRFSVNWEVRAGWQP